MYKSTWLMTAAIGVLLCGSRLFAETDEEMIKRVGLDPRAFSQGKLDPGKLAGLRLWLKADAGITSDAEGRVSAWGDSDRGVTVSQPIPQHQPILVKGAQSGQPAVRFGGNPVSLAAKDFALEGNSLSAVMVARVAKTSHFGGFLAFGPPDKAYMPPFRFGQFSGSGKLELGNGPADRSPLLPGSGFVVLQADYDAAAQRFSVYHNGGLIGSAALPRELPATGPLALGGNLIGDIAEVLVFNAIPNAATRAALTSHLLKKYGLSAESYVTPLASQLPFAYYPSSSEIEVAFDKESPLLREYFGAAASPPTPPTAAEAGLAYAYYNTLPDVKALPDFSKLTPQKTGVTAGLSLAPTSDGTTFEGEFKKPTAVMYKGFLDVPEAGVYTLYLRQYGVAQLFVGDRLVVNQLTGQYGPVWKQRGGVIALAAGKHPITLAAKVYNRVPELPQDLVTFSVGGSIPAAIPAARLSHSSAGDWKLPAVSATKPSALPGALDSLTQVEARVVSLKDGKAVKTFTLPLDAGGRGQSRFKLPELADGEYAVDWLVAGKAVRSIQTFTRSHFPFEKNEIGLEHKVYPPFVPVEVKANTVSVVDREYKVNPLGLFDSVISKGKELLARPMRLVVEDAAGKRIDWTPGKVDGKAIHPDEATFTGTAASAVGSLKSSVTVEEDGCARVTWQIDPAKTPIEVGRMYLEIELPDAAVPFFHYTANDSHRHCYAGKTPRGGKITWQLDQGWVPCDWKAEPGPADGVIWDSTQIRYWSPNNHDNFCPYIWLGAEERGLAWFAGTDHGYVNDGREPVQTLSREGDKVVLRVFFLQQPTTLDKPLSYTFGLQASPTKPLRPDWRTHQVPGGAGCPVNVWGGYLCSDKYPDGGDFTIVDKVQEARKTGTVDEAFFKEKDKARVWPDMKIQFDAPWLPDVLRFAGTGASDFKRGTPKVWSVTYFEEHNTNPRCAEWQVFQDEWANGEFHRFQEGDFTWSQAARSYRDFALYYANEWMKRGVSLYFDNTQHRVVTNPYNQGFVGRTSTIWEQRDYYKRIWKRMTALNLSGEPPYELDFTGHITNVQTIPQNTWFTAELDLEQDYRVDMSRKAPDWMGQAAAGLGGAHSGYRLPFPPDYTRAMTIGRTVGTIPHIMSMLSNFGSGFSDRDFLAKMPAVQWRSEKGMQLVHEVDRPSAAPTWGPDTRGLRLAEYLAWFGYGQPGVAVHNYWEEKPFVSVSDSEVTWLALARKTSPEGLLILQSYKADPVSVTVRFPGGSAMMDLFTRELFTADARGAVAIPLAGIYGTRLLAVAKDRKELPAASAAGDLAFADFELGLSSSLKLMRSNMAVVDDAQQSGNHVLRIRPGHPGHERMALENPEAIPPGDMNLSFRFRLPVVPEKTGACGLLSVFYRHSKEYPKDCGYELRLQVRRADDGTAAWVVEKVRPLREGKEETFAEVGANLIGKPLSGIPVDTQWHRLTIETRGSRHVIRVDDTVVLEGTSDASLTGGFSIGPGWGWDLPLPSIEIDDLKVQKP
jgi:hypothetical protein